MKLDFITIFPEFFEPLKLSLIGKAQDKSLIEICVHDLRDQATNVHRQVDDTPYGRYRDWETDRKSTRLNSSHLKLSRMPSSA